MFDMMHVINKQSFIIKMYYLGQIFDVKDYPIYHQELFDIFENDRCLGLSGKPKLFFFQACRGGKTVNFEPTIFRHVENLLIIKGHILYFSFLVR